MFLLIFLHLGGKHKNIIKWRVSDVERLFFSIADDENNVNVFTEKNEALKVLKSLKDSRLKVFSNKDDAVTYANLGYEVTQTKYEDLKCKYSLIIFIRMIRGLAGIS